MYVALVGAVIVGLSPLGFALFCAVVLSLGLWAHSIDLNASAPVVASSASVPAALVPTLAESMDQLHALQIEINELQAQFSIEMPSSEGINIPPGSSS